MKYLCCLPPILLLSLTIPSIDSQQIPQSFVNPFAPQQQQHRIPLNINGRLPLDLRGIEKRHNFASKENKALIDSIKHIVLSLLFTRLTYVAEFPTAATSYNISDQCKTDSQTYYDSYTGLQNWALRSNTIISYDRRLIIVLIILQPQCTNPQHIYQKAL